MYGEDFDPTGGLTQKYDFVYDFIDDNTFTVSVIFYDRYHTNAGEVEAFKMVEVTHTRE